MRKALVTGALIFAPMAAAYASCTIHWQCMSSGCARVMGSSSGTRAGPSDRATCESVIPQWRSQGVSARCSCSGGGSSSGYSAGSGAYSGMYSGAYQLGYAMGQALGQMLFGGGGGESAAEAAARREMERQAQEERERLAREAAERRRREEEARHAGLVASLRGVEGPSAPLHLRREGVADAAGSNLDLLKRDGISAPLTPFPQGSVPPSQAGLAPNDNLSLLRRGDAVGGALGEAQAAAEQGQLAARAPTPEEAAARASQVFDTPLQQKPVVDLRERTSDIPATIRADNATPISGAGLSQGPVDKPPSVNPAGAPAAPVERAAAAQTAKPRPAPPAPAKPQAPAPALTPTAAAPSAPTPLVTPSPQPLPRPQPEATQVAVISPTPDLQPQARRRGIDHIYVPLPAPIISDFDACAGALPCIFMALGGEGVDWLKDRYFDARVWYNDPRHQEWVSDAVFIATLPLSVADAAALAAIPVRSAGAEAMLLSGSARGGLDDGARLFGEFGFVRREGAQLEFDFVLGLKPRQRPKWPETGDGFLHGIRAEEWVEKGQLLDRLGGEGGRYLAPAGQPFVQRMLPATYIDETLHTYEVVQPFKLKKGRYEPLFGWEDKIGAEGRSGKGRGWGTPDAEAIQYWTEDRTVAQLVLDGYLRRVPPPRPLTDPARQLHLFDAPATQLDLFR